MVKNVSTNLSNLTIRHRLSADWTYCRGRGKRSRRRVYSPFIYWYGLYGDIITARPTLL